MQDWSLVERIAERLAPPQPQEPYSHPSESSLSHTLRRRLGVDISAEESVPAANVNVDVNAPHRRVLARLREILPRFEAAQRSLHPILGGTSTAPPKSLVPIVWLLEDEWKAMVRVCVRTSAFLTQYNSAVEIFCFQLELHEPDLAEETLVLMKVSQGSALRSSHFYPIYI